MGSLVGKSVKDGWAVLKVDEVGRRRAVGKNAHSAGGLTGGGTKVGDGGGARAVHGVEDQAMAAAENSQGVTEQLHRGGVYKR
jgi:hypothetical protein